MISVRLTGLVAALTVISCGTQKKKAAAPSAPPPATAAAAPAAAAPSDARPQPAAQEWTYSSVGKRDPFRSFLAELGNAGQSVTSRCATPLGRFELDQLKLVAVVTGMDDPVAMVEAPNGIGYALRRGACLGRNGGVIATVRTGEVVVSEWAVRADGTREKSQTILRLPKEESLNIEE